MTRKSIYIAATSQHVGKTTMTLGLLSALENRKINVGYSKPLGQQYLDVNGKRVDKDAILFADCMNFDLEPDLHSPVILGRGDTSLYIDRPHPGDLIKKITDASDTLHRRHDIVVFEGTGHPGVGSVVDLSNAEVAKQIKSDVILVLEGGIGNTLDRLALCKAMFDLQGVRIVGVLINKVQPLKMDKIRRYLSIALKKWNIELLGLIPYDEQLVYPSMWHIVKAVNGTVLTGEEYLNNLVTNTIAGNIMEFEQNADPSKLLLVVSYRRLNEALQNFENICIEKNLQPKKIAGIIVTGHGKPTSAQIEQHHNLLIPIAHTTLDTYDAVIKMGHLVAKIDVQNKEKIECARRLFEEHVDIPRILQLMEEGL